MFDSPSEVVFTAFAGILLMLFFSTMTIVSVLRYNNKVVADIHEKNKLKVGFQEELLKAQLEMQEKTLQNISLEIHDNLGQVLTLAKLNLSTTTASDPATFEKIQNALALIAKAIKDLRGLSRTLNTDYIEEMGFKQSVEYELEMLRKSGAIMTSFSVTGKTVPFGKKTELLLFRIVQEAIQNAVKHSKTDMLSVSIDYNENNMEVSVRDNGKGFNMNSNSVSESAGFGLGLRSMHHRSILLGAELQIDSELDKGTNILIKLPINLGNNEKL